jgi:2-haloacid dehalogenase
MNSIRGLVFDAYGTLLDVHSIAATAEALFPGRGEEISRLWRDKQIEYTRLVSLSDPHAAGSRHYQSFESITRASIEYVLKRMDLPLHIDSLELLMQSYRRLRPFAEVESVLASLGQSELPKLPMVVLSNGSREMLEAAMANAELMGFFDRLISADEVRQFKTSPQLYALGPKALGYAAQELLFVSSNGWDVMGAAWFGYQTCWINRAGLPTETIGVAPRRVGADLSCVLEIIQTQRGVS